MDFEQMWAALLPVGRSGSGGYNRAPFASAERECLAWFVEEASRRDLELETDGFGNTTATWHPDGASGPAVLTGSHLDSVLDGGAFDGPLGVVSAFAALDLLREQGYQPSRPIVVGCFVEEEGSRFGLACLGSRLVTGVTSVESAAGLTDRTGVRLGDAWEGADLDPASGSGLLDRVGCFVELHVEQGRDLVDREVPLGLASAIWPHGRYRLDFTGEANHAGTTRMQDRRDPMLTYAMTTLAANKQARLSGQRATFGRVDVVPNGTNAVPSRVTAWLDARCRSSDELDRMVGEIARQATERGARDRVEVGLVAESVSPEVLFDPALAGRLSRLLGDAPVIPTMAGHDAGVLSAAGVPTAMIFVRNPTGVSHSPEEFAPMADCLAGVTALARVLAELAA